MLPAAYFGFGPGLYVSECAGSVCAGYGWAYGLRVRIFLVG